MKKIILLFVVVALFARCNKDNSTQPVNSDSTGGVFRIVASSDQEFSVSILRYRNTNGTVEIIKYSEFKGTLDLNQGFTPNVGDKIDIKAVSASGTFLNVVIVYKGNNLNVPASVKSNTGYNSTFTYEVKE